jgi:aspartate kinase
VHETHSKLLLLLLQSLLLLLLQVFNVFAENSLSIDMVATSEVSISLTLDQSQRNKLSKAVAVSQLAAIADVTEKSHVAIISLIANVERSSEVMAEVFGVMRSESIQVSCSYYCCYVAIYQCASSL